MEASRLDSHPAESAPSSSLGRVPSLTQLHNLEDLVGSSLASAIDTLDLQDRDGSANTEESSAEPWGKSDARIHPGIGGPMPTPPHTAPTTPAAFSTWAQLLKFAQDEQSRALILLNVETVSADVLCGKCLAYGALKYLETEFQRTFGVVFLSYHDLRSAETAFRNVGRQFVTPNPVAVHYCVSLDAAVSAKEHCLIVKNIPPHVRDEEIRTVFSGYGQLRSIQKEMLLDASTPLAEFTVDFFSCEDAKRAAFKMSTAVPWSSATLKVDFAKQSEHDEKSSRQLFALLIHWRKELALRQGSPSSSSSLASSPASTPSPQQPSYPSRSPMLTHGAPGTMGGYYPQGYMPGYAPHYHQIPRYHGALGGAMGGMTADAYYSDAPTPYPLQMPPRMPGVPPPHHLSQAGGMPPFHGGMGAERRRQSNGGGGGGEGDFSLNMDMVMKGLDRRTTLMIRNIPNKYSQTAVLEEINSTDFVGTYDFFYLPIDFKNKCNVGYAFINFIDYQSVVPFFCKYKGRRWNNYNSEKVCAISYARIQGKASMISRFQNSSLMEKDDEYRPLLFISTGVDRGKPELFPLKQRNTSRRGASEAP